MSVIGRSLPVAIVTLVMGCGTGWAAGAAPSVYIFDVLRRPSYPDAYVRMLKGERVPAWFATVNAAERSTTTPGRVVTLRGRDEELYTFCEPHQCGGNEVAVLFSDDGARAVGASSLGGQVQIYGNPTFEERQTLTQALSGGY